MTQLLGRPHVFERGDKVYLTTPLVVATPSEQQIEEFAFASAVKSKAPNDNIGWLQGRYVEAGRANLNNAMWLSDELALKSLTPMLMPVTVMHDPRTAVGTIADCKLVSEQASSRIDNILAIWRHRFPEVWEEASHNLQNGQLMQSMECFTPWYTCSECAQQYIKLPNGAEQASWCDHLRTNSGRRILGDVCFTGTGLIFGSRGGVGAYTDAHLDHFQDEVAEFHDRAHVDGKYQANRSVSTVGLVQIEESELATLRRERDEARSKVTTLEDDKRGLTSKVEQAETAQKAAETERDTAKQQVKTLEDEKAASSLKDKRLGALGSGFMAKLGDTSKQRLGELASTCSDEQWDRELSEREEWAKVKRDHVDPAANGSGGGGGGSTTTTTTANSAFENEEVASFMRGPVTANGGGNGNGGTPAPDGATSVRQLARSMSRKRQPEPANK